MEYSPLQRWGIQHFGLFWDEVRSQYPQVEVKELLISPGTAVMSSHLPQRSWFISAEQAYLIQLQFDRIIFNWRRVSGTQTYPRYHELRPRFLDLWARLRAFLEKWGMGKPHAERCQVLYANHIAWDAAVDLARVSPPLAALGGPVSPAQPVRSNSVFALPDNQGQLTLDLQPALRVDGAQFIQFTCDAQVRLVPPGDDGDLERALDVAHDWALRAFLGFTSPELQTRWLGME